jgi:hypothetical protein
METLEQQLTIIRSSPRKMQEAYLRQHGFLDLIIEKTNDETFSKFSVKDRIDYIVHGCVDTFCHCGNRTKVGAKTCSGACTGRSKETRSILSAKQKENSKERMAKTKETLLNRYGVSHNNHLDHCKESRKLKRELWSENTRRETFAKYGIDIDSYKTKESVQPLIDSCVSFTQLRTTHFGSMPAMTLFRYLRDVLGISHFYDKTSSGSERELREFLTSIGIDNQIHNSRTLLGNGKEVDIYCPDQNIGIEFHGLYWHAGLEHKNTHKEKYDAAKKIGIDLIQIFEDEWIYKQEIVKSILLSKFGKSTKIYARNCKVDSVSYKDAAEFLEVNHLQGKIAGKHVGLFCDGELLSLVTIGKSRFKAKDANYELLRYASKLNTTVIGGFSKMMKFVRNNITEEPILTYCDLRYSSGNTYSKFGEYIRTTAPGYFWANFNKCYRITRFEAQKSKLASLIGKAYDPNKTEKQNMEDSQHALIWDCGHAVFLL